MLKELTARLRNRRTAVRAGALMLVALVLVVLAAPAFADTKRGTSGNDVLRAGDDGTVLIGGAGNDRLIGGDDDDRLYGGPGADRLSGGDDNDRLFGGAGNDVILARDGERDVIRCGAGRDRAVVDRSDRVIGCEVVLRSGRTGGDDGDDDDDDDDGDDD